MNAQEITQEAHPAMKLTVKIRLAEADRWMAALLALAFGRAVLYASESKAAGLAGCAKNKTATQIPAWLLSG